MSGNNSIITALILLRGLNNPKHPCQQMYHYVDYLPVVDDCASSPEKNEQSPVSLSTDIDAHSHMPLQDDANCSPIYIDDSSAENLCKILMSGFQLYKSDENDLLVGNELSDVVLNAG